MDAASAALGICRPAVSPFSRGVFYGNRRGGGGWRIAHARRGVLSAGAFGTAVPHSGQMPLVLPCRFFTNQFGYSAMSMTGM